MNLGMRRSVSIVVDRALSLNYLVRSFGQIASLKAVQRSTPNLVILHQIASTVKGLLLVLLAVGLILMSVPLECYLVLVEVERLLACRLGFLNGMLIHLLILQFLIVIGNNFWHFPECVSDLKLPGIDRGVVDLYPIFLEKYSDWTDQVFFKLEVVVVHVFWSDEFAHFAATVQF